MFGCLRMLCGPGNWDEVSQALKGCIREIRQDIGKGITHRDSEQSAAFD
jgi:hypothetical protein